MGTLDEIPFSVTRYGQVETPEMITGRITLRHQVGRWHVWHVGGKHAYTGQGRPWRYGPAKLWLLHVSEGTRGNMIARIREEATPGARWKEAQARMIARADEMARSDLASRT